MNTLGSIKIDRFNIDENITSTSGFNADDRIRWPEREILVRIDEHAANIFKWMVGDIETEISYIQYRAIVFSVSLMTRKVRNRISGDPKRKELQPLYWRGRVVDTEYHRLSKYFPPLWWAVYEGVCKNSADADISDTLASLDEDCATSIRMKLGYISHVIAFLNDLA